MPADAPRMHPDEHAPALAGPAFWALSRIPIERLEVPQLLAEVAVIASTAFDSATGASVRLIEAGRAAEVGASSELIERLEASQQELGEGPGLSAIEDRTLVYSPSLGGERRWPRFGPRVGREGLHSVLALPLLTDADSLGSLCLFGTAKGAFEDQTVLVAKLLAGAVAQVLRNAQLLAQTRRLADSLQWAAQDGAAVQRAVGILMSRRGIGPDEALVALRSLSQQQNLKLAVTAQQVVDEAVRRARARVMPN
ncbi:MAG: GAF and ANTAR domain-containing protein [Actinomycetota bacterium]|nr:GAF and ANTAR domain-containing protein [Actinomycetota bacterium]MDQ2957341.1 GAF and ANTAR domain-containing protein [Actinomycetota bacterium]